VTPEEAHVIIDKVAEGRWKDVNPLMQKLLSQLNSQAAAPTKPVGGLKLAHLRVNALAVGRDPCIAVNHGLLMHVISARKKLFSINGLGFVQNS
jgi:hypothetical protein